MVLPVEHDPPHNVNTAFQFNLQMTAELNIKTKRRLDKITSAVSDQYGDMPYDIQMDLSLFMAWHEFGFDDNELGNLVGLSEAEVENLTRDRFADPSFLEMCEDVITHLTNLRQKFRNHTSKDTGISGADSPGFSQTCQGKNTFHLYSPQLEASIAECRSRGMIFREIQERFDLTYDQVKYIVKKIKRKQKENNQEATNVQ